MKRPVNLKHVDVLIICGGLGMRLKPVLADSPKGMADIAGKPFIEILTNRLTTAGFHRVILCTGYQSEAFKKHFASRKNPNIEFSEESKPLGTAGAIKNAETMIRSDRILVLNGDSFCPVDYAALLEFHAGHDGAATIVIVRDSDRKDAGVVEFNSKRTITRFLPQGGAAGSYINAGIYVMERNFLGRIPKGREVSLESQVFPTAPVGDLYAFLTGLPLYDIGTPERLLAFKRKYVSKELER